MLGSTVVLGMAIGAITASGTIGAIRRQHNECLEMGLIEATNLGYCSVFVVLFMFFY